MLVSPVVALVGSTVVLIGASCYLFFDLVFVILFARDYIDVAAASVETNSAIVVIFTFSLSPQLLDVCYLGLLLHPLFL